MQHFSCSQACAQHVRAAVGCTALGSSRGSGPAVPCCPQPFHPSTGCWPSLALLWHQGPAGILASQQWGVTSALTLTPKGQNKCAAFTKPQGPQRAEQKYSPKKGILDFEFFQSCFFKWSITTQSELEVCPINSSCGFAPSYVEVIFCWPVFKLTELTNSFLKYPANQNRNGSDIITFLDWPLNSKPAY